MHHRARDVRRRAERRIADDVQVREPRQTERVAEAAATGALDVEEQFRVARQLDAGVDRPQARQRLLRIRSQAVVPWYGDVNRPCACEMRFTCPDNHQRLSSGCGNIVVSAGGVSAVCAAATVAPATTSSTERETD